MDESTKRERSVPFGNSVFQILNFTDGKETPQRRYRHCLLQLSQKRKALKECEFRRRRIDIDIAEIKENIESSNGFEKQRLEIDLEEKEFGLAEEMKLIEDCLVEVHTYEFLLKDLPEFTREEFESGEQEYWEKRLIADSRRQYISTGSIDSGTISSLESIGINISRNEANQIVYHKDESSLNITDKGSEGK